MSGRIAPIFLAASLVFAGGVPAASAEDFGTQIDALYAGFAGAVESEAELEALLDRSKALEKRMRDHKRANRSKMDDAAKEKLRALDDDVDALQGAIRVVGQLGNSADTSVEDFDRAAGRLGLASKEVRAVEPDVSVIQVDVGSYRSVLLRNGSKRNYTLRYAWQTPSMESVQGGVGNSRCERVTVFASRLNSREHDLDGLAFDQLSLRDMSASVEACD